MTNKQITGGVVSAVIGLLAGSVLVNWAGKASNEIVSLNPLEGLATFYFSFVWVGGTIGFIIGTVVLIGYAAGWFWVGKKLVG